MMRTACMSLLGLWLAAGWTAGGADPKEDRPPAHLEAHKEWPFTPEEAKKRQTGAAEALGVEVERQIRLSDAVTLTLVLIPPGECVIGSPEKEEGREDDEGERRIRVEHPFWMTKHEVTQAQWEALMKPHPSGLKEPKNPVEEVSWDDVQKFLTKLNAHLGEGGPPFRLPTEAQWEYACRAGSNKRFCFGDDARELPKHAWCRASSEHKLHAVGTLLPNAWGLQDMHGNVWEWCASPY